MEVMIYIGCCFGYWANMKREYDKKPYDAITGIVLFILTPLSPILFISDLCRAASIYVEKNKHD